MPQLCLPEAERLVSKKSALPAATTAEVPVAPEAGEDALAPEPPLEPHPDNASATQGTHRARLCFDVIRIHPAQAVPALVTVTNAIENYSHLQFMPS